MLHHFRHVLLGLSGSLLLLGVPAFQGESAMAAERITLKFGPFSRSVSVADLRDYSTTGEANAELKPLLGFIKSEQRDFIQKGLKTKLPLNVVQVDKLLRSPIGDKILSEVAKITILPGGAEPQALRSALILSAASEEGFGVLSFLEKYPTRHVTVDVKKAQKLLKSAGNFGSLLQGGLKP